MKNRLIDWGGSKIVEVYLNDSGKWISSLLKEFLETQSQAIKSHRIGGRWENQYLEIDQIPSARVAMKKAREVGKEKLGISSIILFGSPPGSLTPNPPFWFNVAGVGEITGLHDHAHLSILSGVLYLQAEEGSGDLYFRKEGINDLNLRPEVGKMVIFPPFLKHGVHSNDSRKDRISFAFNLFPFPLIQPDL